MIRSRHSAAAMALMAVWFAVGSAQAQKPGAQPQAADRADELLSSGVGAAPQAPAPPPVNDGEAYHRADDAEQDPAEVRTTQALNDEIAARNALAANQERADREAFEADRAKHEAVVAQAIADRLAYEESVREAEAAQRRWEADVRACEAGDRTRCAGPQ